MGKVLSQLGLFLFFYCIVHTGFAKSPREIFKTGFVLNSPVFLDKIQKTSWWISHDEESQTVLIQTTDLLRLIETEIEAPVFERIKTKTAHKETIDTIDLQAFDIEAEFDIENLALTITPAPDIRKKSTLNLSPIYGQASPNDFKGAKYSGHLGINVEKQLRDNGRGQTNSNNSGTVGFFQNVQGLALETGFQYDDSLKEHEIQRDESRLTYDIANLQERLQLGEISNPVTGFQSAPQSLGFSLTKLVNLRPATFLRSSESFSITLKRRSTVEVYVNGIQVERLRLPPGPVNIENLPLNSGVNNVRLKIIDDQGKVEELDYVSLYNLQLLPKNESEYHLSLSAPVYFKNFERHYDFENAYLSSFYLGGVSHKLNYGGAFQLNQKQSGAGFNVARATKVGLFRLEPFLSFKIREYIFGNATRLTWQSNDTIDGKPSVLNLRLLAEKRSFDFAQFGISNQVSKELLDFYASSIFFEKLRIGTGLRYSSFFQSPSATTALADINYRLTKEFNTGINFAKNISGVENKIVLWTLNWTPSSNAFQNFSSYDSAREVFRNQLTSNQNNGVHRVGGLLAYSDQKANKSLDSQLSYRNQRLNSRLDYRENKVQGATQRDTRINLGSGIAWADGAVAVAQPLSSSFAIVNTSEKVEGNIPIGQSNDTYQGEINSYGPAVIANLQPHYRYRYGVDTINIPQGITLGFEDFSTSTSFKQGSKIIVPLDGLIAMTATLVDATATPLNLKTGSVFNDKNEEVLRFFTSRNGKIFLEDLKAGQYLIKTDEVDGKIYLYRFNIAEQFKGVKKFDILHPEGGKN